MLHTILWWKNFKQFFTLTDLEQSYTYIGLLQHNIHVVQYFYSWLRISIFVHSIAPDLPLHFTSKFHFVNITLYQLFFLIQMSSIELIFIIFQTSSLPDRKRKQKKTYILLLKLESTFRLDCHKAAIWNRISELYLDVYCSVTGFDFFLCQIHKHRDSLFSKKKKKRFQATFPHLFPKGYFICNDIYNVGFCRLRFSKPKRKPK